VAGKEFDRNILTFDKLSNRKNKVYADRDLMYPETSLPAPVEVRKSLQDDIKKAAVAIRAARSAGKPVILAFGAHTIKNGLAPVLIRLMKDGWLTHLATNGAGIIHDWELAYFGATSEDVRENLSIGSFGMWQETGFYINLAITIGAYNGLGYGESVGSMINAGGLKIPGKDTLFEQLESLKDRDYGRAASLLDLLNTVDHFSLKPGFMSVPHQHKKISAQAAASDLGVPFTGHPMFGHDIIYTHPANCGAAIGRTAERDFLWFVNSVADMQDGVYLSIGSAVMSPMIFEKALSMARNAAASRGEVIKKFHIFVVDLAESPWNWGKNGEPPAENPAYYLRYCKTFSRCGGIMRYIQADNREFLPAILSELQR